jgi:hypothetical protein
MPKTFLNFSKKSSPMPDFLTFFHIFDRSFTFFYNSLKYLLYRLKDTVQKAATNTTFQSKNLSFATAHERFPLLFYMIFAPSSHI